MESVTGNENGYIVNEQEITYNINIKSDRALEGINVSTSIPEGTELVENTISDEGIVTNGMISWKLDVDGEKIVSFSVKVIKAEGEITNSAVVNGKTTNTVTNTIDEKPVVTVVDSNRYQIEVGTEYVEKGYSAIDKEDGDITDKVVLTYRFQAIDSSNWTDPDTMDTKLLGTYKITYTVTDSMGNVAKGTRVVQIVDTIAPELEVEKLNEAGYVNTENTQINVKDMSPFTTEVFDKDGNLLNTREAQVNDEGTYYDRFGIGWLGEGTFTVKVTDKAGNVTEKTFTVDSIAPELKIEKLNEAGYVNTENTQINVKDTNTFTTEVFDKNGKLLNTREAQVNAEGKYYDRFGIGWLGEGTFTVKVTDKAGNVTEKTFTVDSMAPELEVEKLNEAGYVNTENTPINVKDANPFTTKVFDKDGKLLKTREAQVNDEGTYYDRFGIGWLGEGTFTVRVTDKAGNVTEKTFTVDTIAPEITIKDGSYINTNISPRITEANLESATISKDGEEAQEYPITEGVGREISAEGRYIITLTDKSGNETTVSFTLDKTAPSMKVGEKVYGPETTEIIYSAERFKAEALDDLSGMEQIYTNGHERDKIDVSGEGKYTLRLVDKAGNETTFTVIVDKTAPEFDDLEDNTKASSVSLVVTDKNFDYILIKNNDTGKEWKEKRNWTSFNQIGNYTVQAFDKAGNTSDKYTFTICESVASATIDGKEVEFETFEELFKEIPDNKKTTVKLIKDVEEDIIIPNEKSVEIDLNDKTIKGDKVITNNGTMTIINGTIESTNNGIINNGTINKIDNVTINAERTGINNKGIISEIKNSDIEARFYPIYLSDATIGDLSDNIVTGHYMSGIYLEGASTIEKISSGTYTTYGDKPESGSSVAGFGLYISTNAKVEEIAGGTFKGNKSAVANYGDIEKITGGRFEKKYENDVWELAATFLYQGKINSISGGTFYSFKEDSTGIFRNNKGYTLEDGYEFKSIGDGYYEVVKK